MIFGLLFENIVNWI